MHSIHSMRPSRLIKDLEKQSWSWMSISQIWSHWHRKQLIFSTQSTHRSYWSVYRSLLWIKYFFNWYVLCVSGLLGCRRFRGLTLNYSLLLLEEETGMLYVGARGALYALQASDISSSSPRTVCTHKHISTSLQSLPAKTVLIFLKYPIFIPLPL